MYNFVRYRGMSLLEKDKLLEAMAKETGESI